jgi:hypothetical protein
VELGPQPVVRVPRAQDVVAAAPGDLVDGAGVPRGQAAALGYPAEVVAAAEHRAVKLERLAVVEHHRDARVVGGPGTRSVREPRRGLGEPVDAGDREEAVRRRQPVLVLLVPVLPFGGELGGCGVLNGHDGGTSR